MKSSYKKHFLGIFLNLLTAIILFLALGLSAAEILWVGISEQSKSFDFFAFLHTHGIMLDFILTILALCMLYLHQQFLFKEKLERSIDVKTGRKKGKETALESKFHELFVFAPVGVIETTREGKIIFANPMSCRIFGYSSVQEFIGEINTKSKGIGGLYVNPALREKMLSELYKKNQAWSRFHERFYRRDGSTFFASCYFSLRYDMELEQDCVFGFIEDISEQISMQRKLKASQGRYRDLIEQANSIIIRLDLQGQITYMNEFAERLFGYSRAEVLGRHVTEVIVDPSDLSKEKVDQILTKICEGAEHSFLHENPNICRDGRKIWISWSNKAIFGDDGTAEEILCIGTDLTERRNLEKSLQQQLLVEKMLQETSSCLAKTKAEGIDQAIQESLGSIRGFFQAHCAYVCFLDETGFVKNFCASCSGGQEVTQKFVDEFFMAHGSWWFDKLREVDFVLLSDMNDIPPQMVSSRRAAEEAGLKRLVVAPIIHQERFVGFIGLNFCTQASVWGEAHIKSLRACGEIFLNAMEQRSYHNDLMESRERLDTAVRGAYLGMFDWDITTGKIICNDIWFRMLGYSPHEFPHTIDTWKSLLHPDDKERVFKAVEDYMQGYHPFYSSEYRMKTKEDTWKWIFAQGHIVSRAEDRTPLRMVGLHRDITELKLAEEELRRQRDIFSMLIENMPNGIFAKNIKDGFCFVAWNKRMEELFGLSRHEVIGKNDYDLFPRELAEQYRADDVDVVRSGRINANIKERIQAADGERWVHTIKVPVFDENGEIGMMFGILDDITEREQMEEQLRHTQKMQAVGQLAAGVAHEVKNPLAIILLAAEGLELKKKVLEDEKLRNKIRMIKNAAEKANKVVLELLKFSRLSDSDMVLVDLHQIIEDAHFLSQNRAKEKDITFYKEYTEAPLNCLGNAVLLEQIFVNLFNNSVDAIDGSGEIYVRTRIEARSKGLQEIVIEVEDTGSGIPKKVLPKIFEPFYTTKEVEMGTGLGLSTVFMIVEKHSGTIRIETKRDKGTKFIVTLPFAEKADNTDNASDA